MPPLNSNLTNVSGDALVIWKGQVFVNLQSLIDSLGVGQIEIVYSVGSGGVTGFQIANDFSKTKLFLPPPKAGEAQSIVASNGTFNVPGAKRTGDGHPEADGGGGGMTWRPLTHSITVAGVVPTTTEINTALAATYTDPDPDLVPANGDVIVLTVSSDPKFVATVVEDPMTASGFFVRSFVVNSITYYATLSACGVY